MKRLLIPLIFVLAACGGGDGDSTTPVQSSTPSVTADLNAVTATAQTEWSGYVKKWNDLTVARDKNCKVTFCEFVEVDGQKFADYKAWAAYYKYPLTFDEVLAKHKTSAGLK